MFSLGGCFLLGVFSSAFGTQLEPANQITPRGPTPKLLLIIRPLVQTGHTQNTSTQFPNTMSRSTRANSIDPQAEILQLVAALGTTQRQLDGLILRRSEELHEAQTKRQEAEAELHDTEVKLQEAEVKLQEAEAELQDERAEANRFLSMSHMGEGELLGQYAEELARVKDDFTKYVQEVDEFFERMGPFFDRVLMMNTNEHVSTLRCAEISEILKNRKAHPSSVVSDAVAKLFLVLIRMANEQTSKRKQDEDSSPADKRVCTREESDSA